MFVAQVLIVVLLVAAGVIALVLLAQQYSTREAQQKSVTAAEAFANSPGVVAALDGRNPTAALQPRAEAARKRAGVDFIVVMNTHGIRYTHPFPGAIGKKFTGTIGPSLAGRVTIERSQGGPPLPGGSGPAIQAVVPVFRDNGSIAGLVSAGVKVQNVSRLARQQLPIVLGTGAGALVVATAGTVLVSRRLRRQTHGLGPTEMTRMYEHHDAVLHAVREGVLIVASDGRLLLVNDEARRLLGLPADAERRHVGDIGLDSGTARLLASGEPVTDGVHPAGDRLLAVNKRPTAPFGGQAGHVVTLRDTTELAQVSGRAEEARGRLKLLYDAGMRIGTTLDVVRTAEELADVAVPRFADGVVVDLLDAVLQGRDPGGEQVRQMRRTAISGRFDGLPLTAPGEPVTFAPTTPQARALQRRRAEREADLRQATEWQAHHPDLARRALEHGWHSLVTVPLRARGVVLGLVSFWRTGDSPTYTEEDLSFAEELAARAATCLDNARRFTREHATAVMLQRSLLPRGLPQQNALDIAWRYLPAQAGVGGDWFDVIPLPGARVAVVVGDVVGHGLHAAATMGRLRTAVHNLSALDLPPDELLGFLDELVAQMDAGESDTDAGQEVTGATCLYAIYDPVSGSCTVTRAGHLGPALIHPDGTVTFPQTPVSPPLGLGSGLPVEAATLQLPEGSRLVLFTDGLVEDRHRDLDTGLRVLRDVLAQPGRTPEQTCRAVVEALLSEHPRDDVVLLVARTCVMRPDQVCEWDIPSDPAVVSRIRSDVGRRLETWGLDQLAFATELITSELVTNAIRYGTQPIRLRLLRDRDLVCEVSDGASTSPHLRRAATTDEGGRGLFLIAQFAQRWGTRHTAHGKIIWTEQSTDGGATAPGDDLADALLDHWDE